MLAKVLANASHTASAMQTGKPIPSPDRDGADRIKSVVNAEMSQEICVDCLDPSRFDGHDPRDVDDELRYGLELRVTCDDVTVDMRHEPQRALAAKPARGCGVHPGCRRCRECLRGGAKQDPPGQWLGGFFAGLPPQRLPKVRRLSFERGFWLFPCDLESHFVKLEVSTTLFRPVPVRRWRDQQRTPEKSFTNRFSSFAISTVSRFGTKLGESPIHSCTVAGNGAFKGARRTLFN